MGKKQSKARWEGGEMRIELDGKKNFVAGGTISGIVHVDLKQIFQAYSLVVRLEGKDIAQQILRTDKGAPIYYNSKKVIIDEAETLTLFPGHVVNPQCLSFPFTLNIPSECPQTMAQHLKDFYVKIKYTIKAQMVPVSQDMLADLTTGKSKLRCKEYVTVSAPQPSVANPCYDLKLCLDKTVGMSKKYCSGTLTLSKSYFYPGEIAYFTINLDNTQVGDRCELVVKHVTQYKNLQSNMRHKHEVTHKEEKFHVAAAGQKVDNLVLQFSMPLQRKFGTFAPKPHKQKQAELNMAAEVGPPSSIWAQSFEIRNYFQFNLTHDNTVFEQGSKQQFVFQMLTPSFADHGEQHFPCQPQLVQGEPQMAFPEGYEYYDAYKSCVEGIALE